ncbi:MAG: hypothetical protein HY075_06640 [Deltaproteobacteria bacterium]|nr:hypothetical protein [Deltaproteobacteria bacterium]
MWGTIALLATLLGFSQAATAASSDVLCHRDAEITPVNPSFTNPDDACDGTVLLQGISYKCSSIDEYAAKQREFLHDLVSNGKEYCQDYCRKRGKKGAPCRGIFDEPTKCGWTLPREEAEKFGRDKATCGSSCEGQAFIYCSIYHASFLTVDPKFFADFHPNCRCERK